MSFSSPTSLPHAYPILCLPTLSDLPGQVFSILSLVAFSQLHLALLVSVAPTNR